ncbi:MAG: hypothetical protein HYX39_14620 [Bacteroidetes bacterium]|nr:hypothetical protein [Bacteroidota bacterium]
MQQLLKEEELSKYGLSKEALFEKFKEQLLRDFEMCNVHTYLEPINNASYEAIHSNLQKALNKISVAAYSLQRQLLYRIDISEKQFTEAVHEQKNIDENDVLAQLIIKRILQKVILKLIYSK